MPRGLAGERPLGRLGPADLVHFWAEEPQSPLQVALLVVLEGGRAAKAIDIGEVRRALASRAVGIPRLCAAVAFGPCGGARWVPARDFDALSHVVHCPEVGVGDRQALLAWAAERAVLSLPRARPLWRADVASDVDGRVAVLLVLHHAVADGLAALAIARQLLDDDGATITARPPEPRVVPPWARRLWSFFGRLPSLFHQARALWRELSVEAPRTRLARPLGPSRRLSVLQLPLDQVRATGHRLGATVNDVVLAAVAAGLRDRLRVWGDDPEQLTLRASMPMAIAGKGTNEVDVSLVPVPLAGVDDLARLRAIASATRTRKEARRAGRTASVAPPWVPAFIGRLFTRWLRSAGGRRVNLYVTNVVGPSAAFRLVGARVESVVPVPPLVAGVPLGVAVVSYGGTLVVALHGDGTLEDLDEMAATARAAFDALATAS